MPADTLGLGPVLGHVDVRGQRRAADGPEVHGDHPHVLDALRPRHDPRALELHPMTLPVVHQEAAAEEPLASGRSPARRRVQPARQENDRAASGHCCSGLPWTEKRMVQDWHSGRHPPSAWFRTWICSSVTPQTSGTLHTPFWSRGPMIPPPTGGMPPSSTTEGGAQVTGEPSACAWDALSRAISVALLDLDVGRLEAGAAARREHPRGDGRDVDHLPIDDAVLRARALDEGEVSRVVGSHRPSVGQARATVRGRRLVVGDREDDPRVDEEAARRSGVHAGVEDVPGAVVGQRVAHRLQEVRPHPLLAGDRDLALAGEEGHTENGEREERRGAEHGRRRPYTSRSARWTTAASAALPVNTAAGSTVSRSAPRATGSSHSSTRAAAAGEGTAAKASAAAAASAGTSPGRASACPSSPSARVHWPCARRCAPSVCRAPFGRPRTAAEHVRLHQVIPTAGPAYLHHMYCELVVSGRQQDQFLGGTRRPRHRRPGGRRTPRTPA